MAYINLLNKVNLELKNQYRKLEDIEKKLISIKWSKTFNKVCLKENILPKYTAIRHHDPAISTANPTLEFRKHLMKRDLDIKSEQEDALLKSKENLLIRIGNFNCDVNLKSDIDVALKGILENSDKVHKCRTVKKLNNLYRGQIYLKNDVDGFVNLSDYNLTELEKEFLNLGMNYHIQPKYDKLHKATEIELLYNKKTELEKSNSISLNADIVNQLATESGKHRNPKYVSSIRPELRAAAKGLKQNDDLIIRKADKSAMYVLMDKANYFDKLNDILTDASKFKKIKKDPTSELKQEANRLISTLNAAQGDIHMSPILGDFSPGYIYGNVKTHKPNYPLRPIISQVLTPTYNLAKSLNKIIGPYIPNQYSLKCTNDFIDLLHTSKSNGIIASLDVESLFTNVPIDETIDIILEHTFNHTSLPPPKMPQEILKKMLQLCTKKAPFRTPQGDLFLQIEGVAMGSPLGPTFANFYMGHLEQKVFKDHANKPSIYARYVDDIFLQLESLEQLNKLKEKFQNLSVLNFTYEISVNQKLPFLDVMVESNADNFRTTVYHKPTNHGLCLNANSECTDQYKTSVVINFLNRAYKICSSIGDFDNEIIHIKQMLINNNYSNSFVDNLVKKFMLGVRSISSHKSKETSIPIFYQAQMHKNYKVDEKIIKDIVAKNVKSIDPSSKVKVLIYYKNTKTSNLVMKNNLTSDSSVLRQTNIVYSFSCPFPHSQAEEYYGMTQTTLSRRLTMHGQTGSIHEHFSNEHNTRPSRTQLVENTVVIAKANNRQKLAIKEALLILNHCPSINRQFGNFSNILKVHTHKNSCQYLPHTRRVTPKESTGFASQPSPIPSDRPSPSKLTHSSPLESLKYLFDPSALETLNPTFNTSPELNPRRNNPYKLTNILNTDGSIPDMQLLLLYFGINSDRLNIVPLHKYKWKDMGNSLQHKKTVDIHEKSNELVKTPMPTSNPPPSPFDVETPSHLTPNKSLSNPLVIEPQWPMLDTLPVQSKPTAKPTTIDNHTNEFRFVKPDNGVTTIQNLPLEPAINPVNYGSNTIPIFENEVCTPLNNIISPQPNEIIDTTMTDMVTDDSSLSISQRIRTLVRQARLTRENNTHQSEN